MAVLYHAFITVFIKPVFSLISQFGNLFLNHRESLCTSLITAVLQQGCNEMSFDQVIRYT